MQAGRPGGAGAGLCAATEFYKATAATSWPARARSLDPGGDGATIWKAFCARYPIVSIEDGLAEDDWEGWAGADRRSWAPAGAVGGRRPLRHQHRQAPGARASPAGVANSILVKVNQIGSLTETLEDGGDGAASAAYTRGDVPPFGRDRGRHHRRPGGGHQLRPDQDRLPVALGPNWPSTTSCCASKRIWARAAQLWRAFRSQVARTKDNQSSFPGSRFVLGGEFSGHEGPLESW